MHVSLLISCPCFESENQIYLWVGKNISNYKGLGRLLLLITKYSLFSKQFIWRASKSEYFTGTQNPPVWTMPRLHRSYFSPTTEQTTSVLGCGYHVHISHQLANLSMIVNQVIPHQRNSSLSWRSASLNRPRKAFFGGKESRLSWLWEELYAKLLRLGQL